MKKRIHVTGMHCISCEMILEKEFQKLSGVQLLMVNHKKGLLEVEYKKESDYEKVIEIIRKNGFSISEDGKKERGSISLEKILFNVAVYLGLAVFFYLFSLLDIYRFLPDTSNLSYMGAFLIGIIASVSTCLAITGGIIVGFSRYIDHTKGITSHMWIQSQFQLGRVLGFFLFGGILGYVGNMFQISFGFTGILTFLVGFLFLYMGLQIIGLVPSITKFGLHLPKGLARKIEQLSTPKSVPVVGALTFFLPCGFTQTLQLLAVSSGSFWTGSLIMLFFALGTLPVLFSIGLGSSYFQEKNLGILNRLIGGIMIFFGVFSISNSYNLLNFPSPIGDEVQTEGLNKEVETIEISHDGFYTDPKNITLKKGGNYKIIITPRENGMGCMGTQVIPKLSSKVSYVRMGEPIVYEMNNAKKGSYDIVCATMGMEQGKIIVK